MLLRDSLRQATVEIMRAGSEALSPTRPTTSSVAFGSEQDARGNRRQIGNLAKPDPKAVIIQSMETNPFVQTVVGGPALVAGLIDIYPVFGLRSGRVQRAKADGSPHERLAIEIWRMYADDCNDQRNLIRRHFEAKRATGELAQVRWVVDTPDPKKKHIAYEVLQHDRRVLETNRDKSWTWHRSQVDRTDTVQIKRGDARRVWRKGFSHTSDPTSTLYPLVDLLAVWELTNKALAQGVEHDLLTSEILVGPKDATGNTDWTKDYYKWIKETRQEGLFRLPYPIAVPQGSGDFKLLTPGQSIQEGLLNLNELIIKMLAQFSGMDPKMILEGVGAGTHWNGILMKRDNLQSFIWPTMKLDVIPDVTAWPFRPALQGSNLEFDLEDWGLDGDWRQIAIQPDQLDKLMEMADRGWIADEAPLQAIGMEANEIMQPGSPAWERWVARKEIAANPTLADVGLGAVPPSRQPVGVGGEVFGDAPENNDADSSAMANPTQRAARPRPDELEAWESLPQW